MRLVPIGSRTADYRRAGRPARVLASVTALVAGLLVVAGCRIPGMSPGGILGHENARRFFPLLGTLFVYIFAMNLFGLLPLMDSPTSNLNITFALGLTVFVYVQYVGIRGLGIVGYVDHMLGSPRDVLGWMVAPLMFPIHLMGELAKPISLSCRLFGNIFGEDMLLVAFVSLGITTLSFLHLPIGLAHTFRNESDQVARMLILVAPAGLEQMFRRVGRVADRQAPIPPRGRDEIERLVDIQHMEETLMKEGVDKFADPQHALLQLIAEKRKTLKV